MIEELLPDAEAVARAASALIAQQARLAIRARGRFVLALSGGKTPGRMLELLAGEDLAWAKVHVLQVDERAVGESDPARNLRGLSAKLLDEVPLPERQIHAMPVEDADLPGAAARYAATLRDVAGAPAVVDLVHLGLGADGHTASLVPGDPALDAVEDVAVSSVYEGHRRMTLTFPVLDRARLVLWVVAGKEKRAALSRLRSGDRDIPAGRVSREHAVLLMDHAAAE